MKVNITYETWCVLYCRGWRFRARVMERIELKKGSDVVVPSHFFTLILMNCKSNNFIQYRQVKNGTGEESYCAEFSCW